MAGVHEIGEHKAGAEEPAKRKPSWGTTACGGQSVVPRRENQALGHYSLDRVERGGLELSLDETRNLVLPKQPTQQGGGTCNVRSS